MLNQKSINMDMPEDLLLEINSTNMGGQSLQDKLKLSLAIGLFVEKSISLEKAAELSGKSLARFVNLLSEIGIPAVEYTQDIYADDLEFINKFELENS